MTQKVSVLIPSRNEAYLTQTIKSCFDNARGDLEVVVCLEGYWPSDWKELTAKYPNLHTVHHGEARGMRSAINSAAGSAISRGAKYLFKLDAHCMLDEGFDLKLQADMESNWIVVPRRKRLDAENWQLQDVGKPDIDYHYLSFPDDPKDFGGPGLNGKVWDQRIRERLNKPEYEIDDEMSSQGSAWFCEAAYFEQLELMDAEHWGEFWCEAQEVLMKAWLSGGRCVVNKKTWYAHLHKGKSYEGTDGKKGRGYHLPEAWLKQGRDQTMKWIWNEAWPKQTLPFEWLIDHFWPVPGWSENWRDILYKERKPRSVPVMIDPATTGSAKADDYIPPAGLQIYSAIYGVDADNTIDVTERVRELAKDGFLDIRVDNSTLTPGQNPFRGRRKFFRLNYSYDGGEIIQVQRAEKEILIIGKGQRETQAQVEFGEISINEAVKTERAQREQRIVELAAKIQVIGDEAERLSQPPRTAAALNDYLIRRFSISSYRLRAPMPIELNNFHRNDLAKLFGELGFTRGAEIGVAEGNYSEVLFKANPQCEILLVDPWHAYSNNPQNKTEEKHAYAFNEMMRKTEGYEGRRVQMMNSMKAVGSVALNSLDFCYIDGHHSFDFVMQDLIEWSKRVRSGGIVSGDDYYALDEKRWGAGPIEAVQAYTKAHRIAVWYIFQGHKSVDFMWVKG